MRYGTAGPRRTGLRNVGGPSVAVLALVLAFGSPRPAVAQTGLLVLGGPEAGEAGASIRWTAGPVELRPYPAGTVTPGAWSDALTEGVAALAGRGARQVVVVAVGTAVPPAPPPEPRLPSDVPVRFAALTGAGAGGGDPSDLARRIERRALAALEVPPEGTEPIHRLDAVAVTATRTPLDVFGTAAPVALVDGRALADAADVLEPLRRVPGVDLSGVGPVRRQPVLRGFTGQRVLLLEDGLRVANGRRRVESVEPASLVGVGTAERIEIVRGPASVLYGSDAIGGVVNVVTRGAPDLDAGSWSGLLRLTGSTAGAATRAGAGVRGRTGPLAVALSASRARGGSYRAPSGTFGGIDLPAGARVHDSGAREDHLRAEVAVAAGPGSAFLRGETYRAEDTGFGWVEPSLLGDDPTRLRLTFPDHRWRRLAAGWRAGGLSWPGLDALDLAVFRQDNRREFVTDVLVPLGPQAPPDARLGVVTTNRTDLATSGGRLEATTRVGEHHALTWGLDAYRERARGSDTTVTTVTGLGPPSTRVTAGSGVPTATLSTLGLFLQDRWTLHRRMDATLGVRWQGVWAAPRDPPGADGGGERHTDRTVVGSASLLLRTSRRTAFVASLARGFRSPNLVERFFSGPTPGGRGTWVRNPALEAETSLTADLGVRIRGNRTEAEVFAYRTVLSDGILLVPTGRETGDVPEYRNENVDRIVVRGVEAWASWAVRERLTLTGSLEVRDRSASDPATDPFTGGRRAEATAGARTILLPDRLEAEYSGRWTGSRTDPLGEDTPVGRKLPGHHVHDVDVRLLLGSAVRLTLGVHNLGDRLWAESANAGFFRPEPGRTFRVGLLARF